MSDQAIIRFAPSPNGALHLGHAYSALVAQRVAQALGARFLLRIEDIDISRCRPEYEAQMLDDLRWLGLEWEEPVRRQSEHFDDYAAALRKLAMVRAGLPLGLPCHSTTPVWNQAITALRADLWRCRDTACVRQRADFSPHRGASAVLRCRCTALSHYSPVGRRHCAHALLRHDASCGVRSTGAGTESEAGSEAEADGEQAR